MKKFVFLLFPLALNGQTDKHDRNYTFTLDTIHDVIFVEDSIYAFIYHEVPYHKDSTEDKLEPVAKIKHQNFDLIYDYHSSKSFLETNRELNKSLNIFSGINKKKLAIGYSLMFLSGISAGYKEVILHHYPQFKKVHPYANDQYFNPDESWRNKYKNGDPNQGEAFWQSKGLLVGVTDFYHLVGIMDHTMLIGGTVTIVIGEKKKWWQYGMELFGGMAVRGAGFSLIYDVIYK